MTYNKIDKMRKKRLSKKVLHLGIKKATSYQGKFLSQDNGLCIRLDGIKFPFQRGERYLTKNKFRALEMALDEFEKGFWKWERI
jgi:hypothetical protein